MGGRTLDLLERYGAAVALAALVLFIRGALPFAEGTAIYQLPLTAVVMSAWYGGRGPGLVTAVLSAIGTLYFFVPPVKTFHLSPEHALGFGLFLTLCLLVVHFGASVRRAAHAMRASEERFRTLVQFSFDVYWESDAQHRFTRQEFSERLTDAPAPGSEIGKTRWEIPYLEPDEEAWREHRATLDAHLPFRDFELARPTPEGGKRYVSVSGMPVFDEFGNFVGYRGVGRHITERKLAEIERRTHLWFLESLDRVNRAVQGAGDVEQMMADVLEAVLEIFRSDRAWLLYPCDPGAPSWRPVMERTRPEFPGAAAHGGDLPMTEDAAEVARAVLDSHAALPAGPGHERQVKPEIAERFRVRSEILVALRPKGDRPYLFGLHQCARPRTWTKDEQRLFEEIGHRLTDALDGLIAVRSLRESEQRLEAAQRVARIGWWERDYASGRVSLSDEACRIFGVKPVDLPQWHGRWLSLIHPDDRQKAADVSDRALRGEGRYDIEYRVVRPDGGVRFVHSQGDVTRDASGRPLRQFGVMQDVTELRQTQRRLEAAQRIARVGWWERDYIAGRITVSDEAAEMYGIASRPRVMDLAEWRERQLPSIIHPEDRQRVAEAMRGVRYDLEYRVVRPDGTVRVVHVQAEDTHDDTGRPVRQFGVAKDITELRQAEQGLRARQQMLDLAQQAAHAVAFDWYLDERESENRWSPELEAMYGLEPGTFDRTYKGWRKLIHPDDWPSVKQAIEHAHRTGDVAAEYRVLRKDGGVRWLHARGRMFFDAERRPERMIGFMIDVTDRKQAEQELRAAEVALRESEQRYRTFVDHATDAFFLHDEALVVIDVNRQACESLDYSRQELIGMHPRDFDVALSPAAMAELSKRAECGQIVTFETLHRRKDGAQFPVEIRVAKFEQGQRYFHLSLARDISERKRAEETMRAKDSALQLARAELARISRLTTLGELTASIAHEVNQPIGAMVTNAAACARWLSARPPDMAEAQAALANIVADGKRAGEVIRRIRGLTKRQLPRMEPLDVNRKIAEVLALAHHELKSQDVVLRTELDPTLPPVAADGVQLQQVLLNLILNAMEAMSGVHDRPRELILVSRRSDGNAVMVEVRDSGPGLDADGAERVFEAFYTTKPQGVGIGLSISRSIVDAHGGRLWANPNEPRGAVFRFTLPLASAAQSPS